MASALARDPTVQTETSATVPERAPADLESVGDQHCEAGSQRSPAPSAGDRPRRAGRVKGGAVRGPRAPHSTVATRYPPGTLDPTATTSRAASTRKPGRTRVRATGVRYGRTVQGQPWPLRRARSRRSAARTVTSNRVPKLLSWASLRAWGSRRGLVLGRGARPAPRPPYPAFAICDGDPKIAGLKCDQICDQDVAGSHDTDRSG